MKARNYQQLEKKTAWRFIKVVYIVVAIIASFVVTSSNIDKYHECYNYNDPQYIQNNVGSRLIRNKLLENLNNGHPSCDATQAPSDLLIRSVILLMAVFGGYFLLRALTNYILLGSRQDDKQK